MGKSSINLKILIFNVYPLNIDISLIIKLICFKTCMYIAEICFERSKPHYFDIGLRFCFRMYRII